VFLTISSISKDFKTGIEDRGWGYAGDDVLGAVGDIEEGIVFNIFKDGPGKLRGGGAWDRDNG